MQDNNTQLQKYKWNRDTQGEQETDQSKAEYFDN